LGAVLVNWVIFNPFKSSLQFQSQFLYSVNIDKFNILFMLTELLSFSNFFLSLIYHIEQKLHELLAFLKVNSWAIFDHNYWVMEKIWAIETLSNDISIHSSKWNLTHITTYFRCLKLINWLIIVLCWKYLIWKWQLLLLIM